MEPVMTLLGYARALHKATTTISEIERRQNDRRRKEIRAVRAAKRAEIFKRGLQIEFLSQYYGDTDLAKLDMQRYCYVVNGRTESTTMATKKSWTGLQVPLDGNHVKAKLSTNLPDVPLVSDTEAAAITAEIASEGLRVYNQPIFRLVDMRVSKKMCHVQFGLAHFFDFVFSVGNLEDELLQALIDADLSPEKVIEKRERYLPLRSKFIPDAKTLLDLQNRLCIGGSYVLLAFARPHPFNDYIFFAKKRSTEVYSGRDVTTLVPMGYHQPTSDASAASEILLTNSIFREMAEEMLGYNELIDPKGHALNNWYMDFEPLQWFANNQGHFTFELVSAAFNLMQGNYEFGVLFAIHDLSYLKQFGSALKFNWEQDDPSSGYFSTRDPRALEGYMTDTSWSDGSRITLVEALKRLKSLDSSRVKLPNIERQVG